MSDIAAVICKSAGANSPNKSNLVSNADSVEKLGDLLLLLKMLQVAKDATGTPTTEGTITYYGEQLTKADHPQAYEQYVEMHNAVQEWTATKKIQGTVAALAKKLSKDSYQSLKIPPIADPNPKAGKKPDLKEWLTGILNDSTIMIWIRGLKEDDLKIISQKKKTTKNDKEILENLTKLVKMLDKAKSATGKEGEDNTTTGLGCQLSGAPTPCTASGSYPKTFGLYSTVHSEEPNRSVTRKVKETIIRLVRSLPDAIKKKIAFNDKNPQAWINNTLTLDSVNKTITEICGTEPPPPTPTKPDGPKPEPIPFEQRKWQAMGGVGGFKLEEGDTHHFIPLSASFRPVFKSQKVEMYGDIHSTVGYDLGAQKFLWGIGGGNTFVFPKLFSSSVIPSVSVNFDYASGNLPFFMPYYYASDRFHWSLRPSVDIYSDKGIRLSPYAEGSYTYFKNGKDAYGDESGMNIYGRDLRLRVGFSFKLPATLFWTADKEWMRYLPTGLSGELGYIPWGKHSGKNELALFAIGSDAAGTQFINYKNYHDFNGGLENGGGFNLKLPFENISDKFTPFIFGGYEHSAKDLGWFGLGAAF